MNNVTKIVTVVVLASLLGFMLSPQAPIGAAIWPPNPAADDLGTPSSMEIGMLMFYTALASIAFGFGVAFLAFGLPLVERAPVSRMLARMAYLGIAWLLVTWVPHDALHQHITSYVGLLALEYGFHFTLMLSGLALARFFLAVVTGGEPQDAPEPAAMAATAFLAKR